jgi:hypothetical protein
MLRSGRPGIQIPVGARNISLFQKIQNRPWGHPVSYSMGTSGLAVPWIPEVKRPGRKINYSRPSSAEVKSEWSYTSTPPTCRHGVDRENFTFTLHGNQFIPVRRRVLLSNTVEIIWNYVTNFSASLQRQIKNCLKALILRHRPTDRHLASRMLYFSCCKEHSEITSCLRRSL